MNVRLQYDVEFLAGVYYEGTLKMNSYSVSMNLLTTSIDPIVTNVAMDRLKYFVYGVLESTVFINSEYHEQAEMLALLGINVTTLPQEPVDQIIGMMLYYKLNAIMEGNMIVTALDISSTLGDSVWYQHDEEDSPGPFAKDGWWRTPGLQHDTIELDPPEDKVVKVINTGWHELGLEWPDPDAPPPGNIVVFGNFGRNEN
jgi:hypothetical protein